MSAAHTPGPWQLEGHWSLTSRKLGGWVSTLHPCPMFELNPLTGEKDEIIANAHLIAAAPDMLAALQAAVEVMGRNAAFDQCVDAIAKAEARP